MNRNNDRNREEDVSLKDIFDMLSLALDNMIENDEKKEKTAGAKCNKCHSCSNQNKVVKDENTDTISLDEFLKKIDSLDDDFDDDIDDDFTASEEDNKEGSDNLSLADFFNKKFAELEAAEKAQAEAKAEVKATKTAAPTSKIEKPVYLLCSQRILRYTGEPEFQPILDTDFNMIKSHNRIVMDEVRDAYVEAAETNGFPVDMKVIPVSEATYAKLDEKLHSIMDKVQILINDATLKLTDAAKLLGNMNSMKTIALYKTVYDEVFAGAGTFGYGLNRFGEIVERTEKDYEDLELEA